MASSDRNGLESLERELEGSHLVVSEIRNRLPASLNDSHKRAAVCAIRNPDAPMADLADTAGVTEPDVLDALLHVAEDRLPLTDDLGETESAVLDAMVDKGRHPDSIGPKDINTFTTVVSRRTGDALNPSYVEGIVERENAADLYHARRLERIITDARQSNSDPDRSAFATLLNDIGLRGVLELIGEDPPGENMDAVESPDVGEFEYTKAGPNASNDDIEPGVRYWAEVNNVKSYGVFVSLTKTTPDNVSGLVHKSDMPAMCLPTDFEVGDEVMVRLILRKENGDIGFELAGIIDATRFDRHEFEPRAEFTDRTTRETDEVADRTPRAASEPSDTSTPSPAQGTAPRATSGASGGGHAAQSRGAAQKHGYFEDGDLYCRHCGGGPFEYPFGLPGHLKACDEYLATKADAEPAPDPTPTNRTLEEVTDTELRQATSPVELTDGRWMCPHIEDGDRCGKVFDHERQARGHMSVHAAATPPDLDEPSRQGSTRIEEVDRKLEGIPPETGEHEVLTILRDVADEDNPVSTKDVMWAVESIQPQSTSPSLATLYRKKLVDREITAGESGGQQARYWVSPYGELELESIGRHPAHPDPVRLEDKPDPNAPPAAPDSDFASDLQMRVGIALGRGDITTADAVEALRRMADRLERGGWD